MAGDAPLASSHVAAAIPQRHAIGERGAAATGMCVGGGLSAARSADRIRCGGWRRDLGRRQNARCRHRHIRRRSGIARRARHLCRRRKHRWIGFCICWRAEGGRDRSDRHCRRPMTDVAGPVSRVGHGTADERRERQGGDCNGCYAKRLHGAISSPPSHSQRMTARNPSFNARKLPEKSICPSRPRWHDRVQSHTNPGSPDPCRSSPQATSSPSTPFSI